VYCQAIAEVAAERGWGIRTYDPKTVEADAIIVLGPRAKTILHGPRNALGPPWSKDHRIALAATIVTDCRSDAQGSRTRVGRPTHAHAPL
jgi:hypothetical protein